MNPSIYRWSIAWAGLALCAAFILVLTMWPTPIDRGYESAIDRVLQILHNRGVPEWFGYRKFEFAANIVMFVPFGFFTVLSLPKNKWWIAILLIPLFSISIETAQKLFLSQRFSSVFDVIANSIGGYVGIGVAIIIWSFVWSRDRLLLNKHDLEQTHTLMN